MPTPSFQTPPRENIPDTILQELFKFKFTSYRLTHLNLTQSKWVLAPAALTLVTVTTAVARPAVYVDPAALCRKDYVRRLILWFSIEALVNTGIASPSRAKALLILKMLTGLANFCWCGGHVVIKVSAMMGML